MKPISRNKVLLCFRPDMDMEADIYFLSNNKTPTKGPTSPLSECSMYSGESETNRPPKRSFTRAVKAIFFGVVLKRRWRQQKFSPSKRSSSVDSERRPFMALPSSSAMSDESKNETKARRDFGQKQRKIKRDCSNVEAGPCMLLMSLGITVCWGRFCAILFTSVWLYLIPLKNVKLDQTGTKKERMSAIVKHSARKGRYLICSLSLLLLLLLWLI